MTSLETMANEPRDLIGLESQHFTVCQPCPSIKRSQKPLMATRMVRMIRSVQPAGPYRVAGWSLGGTIAYEIATQLVGAHEQVEFIGLFDTCCPRSSAVARQAKLDFNDSDFLLNLIESAGTGGDGRKAALDSIRASLHTLDFADVFLGSPQAPFVLRRIRRGCAL